jgi:hypothetical protein
MTKTLARVIELALVGPAIYLARVRLPSANGSLFIHRCAPGS